jgi:membrane protease YdiL (CAAX protease family)
MTRLIEFLKRHQLISYFVLTYAFTWTLWLAVQPAYLEGEKSLAPLLLLGTFGPALVSIGLSALISPGPRQGSRKPAAIAFIIVWILASAIMVLYLIFMNKMELSARLVILMTISGLLPAFVVSSAFSRCPGERDLLRTLIKPRGSFVYYLLALLLFPALWFLGAPLSRLLGMDAPLSRYPVEFNLVWMVALFFVYGFIFGGLTEEPGWRGFALPRLQARFSPLVSSLILGVIWAFWHAPARFGGVDTKSLQDTISEWILIVLVSVIFTWLFNRTRGSILVTALIHPAMNTTGSFLFASSGALLLLLLVVILVIVIDRMWRRLPADNPAAYQPGP